MQTTWASPGAIVIGGDYRGLGIVRSLGRHHIPIAVLRDHHSFGAWSRFVKYRFDWPAASDEEKIELLLDLSARHGFRDWALFPTTDETAALIAQHHTLLSDHFIPTTPPWETLRTAYDKRCSYRMAAQLGIPIPFTHCPASRAELARLELAFPLILKPAIKHEGSQFTRDKAWPVANRDELLVRYDEASKMIDPAAIMLQELIPGDGASQFSFAAVCAEGNPLASITALRRRQYPIDFGQSSSFVESIAQPEVERCARKLLAELRFTGLVEVEFKRDPRDGEFKLLDINPRIWGWHTLGRRAGVDFPFLMWQLINGVQLQVQRGRDGVRWVRGITDVLAVTQLMRAGKLSALDYLRSVRPPVECAVWAIDDPFPALCEIPALLKARWKIWQGARLPEPAGRTSKV